MAIIVKKKLDDFRKMFVRENQEFAFPDYILRIRKEEDIAYYNGIAAFYITAKDQSEIYLNLPEDLNVYKCNTTTVVKLLNDNKNKEEVYQNGGDYVKTLSNSCQELSIKTKKVTIRTASEYQEAGFREKLQALQACQTFSEILTDYEIERILQDLKTKKKASISCPEKEASAQIQFDVIKTLKLQKNGSTYAVNKLIEAPSFEIKADPNIEIDTDKKLKELMETAETAINYYEGKEELEKKYQHMFMLRAARESTGIFPKANIYPLEQEYHLENKDRIITKEKHGKIIRETKQGRIDSVFFAYNEQKQVIEDIYLVELKVNKNVVLESNGVMTHLDDIKYLVNKNKKEFLSEMLEVIEYREQHARNAKFQIKNKNEIDSIKLHFYTVFGFFGEHSSKEVLQNEVTECMQMLCVKEKRKGQKFVYFEEITLQELIAQIDKSCEIKFLYDTNKWNGRNHYEIHCIKKEINDFIQYQKVKTK